jgi:glycopeptide antibiotics resistance protein
MIVKKRVLQILLLVYSLLLIKVMVFKDVPLIRVGVLMLNFGGTHDGPPNFIPFKTILPYLIGEKGLLIGAINIVGNIILLVPVGLLVPFVFPAVHLKKSILFAVFSGLLIEGMQTLLHVGIFDIDDVILNGLGYLIGYWIYLLLPRFWNLLKSSKLFLGSLVAVVLATVYIFYSWYLSITSEINMRPEQLKEDIHSKKNIQSSDQHQQDPCRGTGGTGTIMKVDQHAMVIQRKDGVEELIHITEKTTIKQSSGNATVKDLRVGDHVTVVVGLINEDAQAASLILICST